MSTQAGYRWVMAEALDQDGDTRRERKRVRARKDLVDSASALIAEHGLGRLRISDVTDRSDVALGSFYRHFETKDEIITAVVAEAVSALADSIGDIGEHLVDPAEAMSVGVRKLCELPRTDPALAALLVKLTDAENRFEQLIWPRAHLIMDRGVATGRFPISDRELLLAIAIAGVFSTVSGMVEGRFDASAGTETAVALLRLVGIPDDEAHELASRELPG
jgi:AcrR family transcriptional regulator